MGKNLSSSFSCGQPVGILTICSLCPDLYTKFSSWIRCIRGCFYLSLWCCLDCGGKGKRRCWLRCGTKWVTLWRANVAISPTFFCSNCGPFLIYWVASHELGALPTFQNCLFLFPFSCCSPLDKIPFGRIDRPSGRGCWAFLRSAVERGINGSACTSRSVIYVTSTKQRIKLSKRLMHFLT